MPSQAARQAKAGFWLAAGFALFALTVAVLVALAGKAVVTK